MTDAPVAVAANNLGKQYDIGTKPGTGRLYDRLASVISPGRATEHPTIWALRDVSFEVSPGSVLGVIGRNGSGKSTLMKILARVTVPTEGVAMVTGRVGALLQVGTGFHPELTGRENISLSGAILGMTREEIQAVEDQVVDFAEIGRFLDTPVKHYSSGMYMRLAFSVSAHLAAEIMLVDEVLSVGDAEFQKKCKARIRELVDGGRTVLFVSHSMDSVQQLCDSTLVLEQGRVVFAGDTREAVHYYNRQVLNGRLRRVPATGAAATT
jgi:lipopolysaccharide transport system ATP-binding protein